MQKLFAVIGDPIGHSLSPVMHQRWLQENDLDGHYHAFQVRKEDLKEAVNGLRALGVQGFNVTIPHKVSIMQLLDQIDEEATAIGAVNTVINQDGHLIGTNTDGIGFIRSLEEKGFEIFPNDKILFIGAGGAARAVSLALARFKKAPIDFANRTLDKAGKLREKVSMYADSNVITLEEAAKRLSEYRVVINATPVGMSGFSNGVPIPMENLNGEAFCVDLIYRPLRTSFLEFAQEKGCRTINGLPMLIHQGAVAFKRWTGIEPDTQRMETYLTQKLMFNHKE
ncbi:MAG: shikimate dehydrogenase [Tuberibacillus sp.]